MRITGDGGYISITAGSTEQTAFSTEGRQSGALTINGNLNASGKGAIGYGGTVKLHAYGRPASGGGGPIGSFALVAGPEAEAYGQIQLNGSILANGGAEAAGGFIDIHAETSRSGGNVLSTQASVQLGDETKSYAIRADGGILGGGVDIYSNGKIYLNATTVSASATEDGNGGNINVRLDAAPVGDDGGGVAVAAFAANFTAEASEDSSTVANVSFRANGAGTGSGGTVAINAAEGVVTIAAPSTVALSANSGSAGGEGGALLIAASKLMVTGSFLAKGQQGNGQLVIAAEQEVQISAATIDTSSQAEAKGGKVDIASNNGSISISADLKADGGLSGDGGDITIHAQQGNITIGSAENKTQVFARGGSQSGSGGSISIAAHDEVMLNVTDVSVGSRAGVGDAGSIKISSSQGDITIMGKVTASAKSDLGDGGNISLKTQGDFLTVHGDIDFSARVNGNGGSLTTDPHKASNYFGHILGYAVGADKDGGYWTETTNGDINYKDVQLWSLDGNGGYLKLDAKGNITIDNDINTWGYKTGGFVEISSEQTIKTGAISTYSFGTIQNNPFDGGGLILKANAEVSTGRINASSASGRAGSIFIQTQSEIQFVIGASKSQNGINGEVNISGVTAGPLFVEPTRLEEGTYFYVENSGSGGISYSRTNALIADTSKTLPPGVVLVAKNGPISIDGKLQTEGLLQSPGGYVALISDRLDLNANVEAIAVDIGGGIGGTIHIATNKIIFSAGAKIAATGTIGGSIDIGPRASRQIQITKRDLMVPKVSINLGSYDGSMKIQGKGQSIIYANGTRGGGDVAIQTTALGLSAVPESTFSLIVQANATENGAGGSVRFEPLLFDIENTRLALMADASGQHSSGYVNISIGSFISEDRSLVIGNGLEMLSVSAFGGRTDASPNRTGIALGTLEDVTINGSAINLNAAANSDGNRFFVDAKSVTVKGELIVNGGEGKKGGLVNIRAGRGIFLDNATINTRPPSLVTKVDNGTILLDAQDGNIEKLGGGQLSSDLVVLRSNSTVSSDFSSSIGSASGPIFTQASNLSVQVTKGNAYIRQAGDTLMSDTQVNGYIYLKVVGDSLLGNGSVTGNITAKTVDIKTTSGNIGLSDSPLNVTAQTVHFSSGGDLVRLIAHSHLAPDSLAFSKTTIGGEFGDSLGQSRSSGSIHIEGQDVDLEIAAMVAQNGPVSIRTNKSANILKAPSVNVPTVKSNSKDIGIQAAKRIVFENGSSIISVKGIVTATAGASLKSFVDATDSALIDVNTSKGGHVFFSHVGLTVTGTSKNVLTTSGNGAIILDAGEFASAIELQGGVSIKSAVPIAYCAGLKSTSFRVVETGDCQISYDHLEFKGVLSDKGLNVVRGTCIIRALRKTQVKLGNVLLHLPKNSIVQIDSTGSARNLFVTKVVAEVDTIPITLCAGEELSTQQSIQDSLARRNTKIARVSGKNYYLSEVPLSAVLSQNDLLRAFGHSTDRGHLLTLKKVQKVAAALSIVTAGHGPYSRER